MFALPCASTPTALEAQTQKWFCHVPARRCCTQQSVNDCVCNQEHSQRHHDEIGSPNSQCTHKQVVSSNGCANNRNKLEEPRSVLHPRHSLLCNARVALHVLLQLPLQIVSALAANQTLPPSGHFFVFFQTGGFEEETRKYRHVVAFSQQMLSGRRGNKKRSRVLGNAGSGGSSHSCRTLRSISKQLSTFQILLLLIVAIW